MSKLELSWWDRTLLAIAPGYALNRIRAREATRHYEAAQPGRRTQNWRKDATDADQTLRGAARDLRMSARDLLRNNGHAIRGQATIANNTVGSGIRPKALGPNAARGQVLWKRWADSTECESDNRQTFSGIQHLVMRSLVSDGEVFIRRRWRRAKDQLTIPMQLQVLEADFLDSSKNLFESQAGGPVIQGIEFDKIGRRAAYWLWPEHPGSGRNIRASQRISADEVIHVYDARRAGQSRGVSWLGAAIVKLHDLDDFEDAELMRQKIAACFAAFVTDTDGTGSAIGDTNPAPDDQIETFEPGMIVNLPTGKNVVMANPPTTVSEALPIRTLRRVAAALGVSYEDLSGDYSQVNFSSARMGRLVHQANVRHWQEMILIPTLCKPVWDWAMEAAMLAGEIVGEAPESDWTAPPLPMLEPDKEGLALNRLVRVGAMTPSQMVREQGFDPDDHWAEYAADLAKLDDFEITLDCDARQVTQAGLAQPPEPSPDTQPPEPSK